MSAVWMLGLCKGNPTPQNSLIRYLVPPFWVAETFGEKSKQLE